jgi:hypothetical protein
MNKEYGQSPDELFDVVDEKDQVLYPLSRGEIHKRHLRHRAVHIFWLNQAANFAYNDGPMLKITVPDI